MLRLLVRTLAKEFYQQHAGFFLFALYVLFGIVEPRQVIGFNSALLLSGISSPLGMALVVISWILYSLKVWLFIQAKLSLPQYNFIRESGSLSKSSQLTLWIKFYLIILLPVFVYFIILVYLSVKYQLFLSLAGILIAFFALHSGLTWMSFQRVSFGFLRQQSSHLPALRFRKRFFSWPIYYLFNEQLVQLLMCKILSFAMFKGILWMFADVAADVRTLLIALLASILCHSVLVFNLLTFETKYLSFTRSLPMKTISRFVQWLFVFLIILIPEWIFFMMASHYHMYAIADGFLFGLGGLFFLLVLLYTVRLDMESYLKMLLLFFFIAIWAILGHYYVLFSFLMIGSAFLFYVFRFDKIDLRG